MRRLTDPIVHLPCCSRPQVKASRVQYVGAGEGAVGQPGGAGSRAGAGVHIDLSALHPDELEIGARSTPRSSPSPLLSNRVGPSPLRPSPTPIKMHALDGVGGGDPETPESVERIEMVSPATSVDTPTTATPSRNTPTSAAATASQRPSHAAQLTNDEPDAGPPL